VTEIPSVDPLNSRFDEKHVTLTDKLAITLYQGASSNYRLAAFDLATGKRVWDRAVGGSSGYTPVCLVVAGDVSISLANVELLTIRIRLLVCSIDKAEQIGLNWWRYDSQLSRRDGESDEVKRLEARIAELEAQLKKKGE
jgi:hypothetical protein